MISTIRRGRTRLDCRSTHPHWVAAHAGVFVLFVVVSAMLGGLLSSAVAKVARVVEENGFLVYDLDRSNLRPLPSGDFMFRLAVDKATGATFWAYMGTTEDIVVTLPQADLAHDDSAMRALVLRIVHLPKRVGCGVGTIHTSNFMVLADHFEAPLDGGYGDLGPRLVEGQIQNDTSGAAPPHFLSYFNRFMLP